jgi:type IV conjugative transfer system protein TraL
MQQVKIPRYVDDQLSFLIWDFDEFTIVATLFGLGIITGHTFIGLIAAWYFSGQFRKTKGNYLNGRLEHMAFYLGFWDLNQKFKHGGKERIYTK